MGRIAGIPIVISYVFCLKLLPYEYNHIAGT
jgi:hypothetical protein